MGALTGLFVSSSYQRLFVRDRVITDGTGSIIPVVNISRTTSSIFKSEDLTLDNLNLEFQGTSSFRTLQSGAFELYDQNETVAGLPGSVMMSGSRLYFAPESASGVVKPDVLTPTTSSIYLTPIGSNVDYTLEKANIVKYYEIISNPPLLSSQSLTLDISYSIDHKDLRFGTGSSKEGSVTSSFNYSTTGSSISASILGIEPLAESSSKGVCNVTLNSDTIDTYITASITGTRVTSSIESEVLIWIASSSVQSQDPELHVKQLDLTASLSASLSAEDYRIVETYGVPSYMSCFITGANRAITHPGASPYTASLSKYYYDFSDRVVIFKNFVGVPKNLNYNTYIDSSRIVSSPVTVTATFEENNFIHRTGLDLENLYE